jgi:hypothetical protein
MAQISAENNFRVAIFSLGSCFFFKDEGFKTAIFDLYEKLSFTIFCEIRAFSSLLFSLFFCSEAVLFLVS